MAFWSGRGGRPSDADADEVSVPPIREVVHPVYAPHQAWTYAHRPHEPASRLILGRLDRLAEGGIVAHVQLVGLSVKNARVPGGVQTRLGHTPIMLDALVPALGEQVSGETLDGDAFDEGYATWRRAVAAGQGGAFSIPPAQVADAIEEMIAQSMTEGEG